MSKFASYSFEEIYWIRINTSNHVQKNMAQICEMHSPWDLVKYCLINEVSSMDTQLLIQMSSESGSSSNVIRNSEKKKLSVCDVCDEWKYLKILNSMLVSLFYGFLGSFKI